MAQLLLPWLAAAATLQAFVAAPSPLEVAANRLAHQFGALDPNESDRVLGITAVEFATALNLSTGKWPDVRYRSPPGVDTRTDWPAAVHLARLEMMARGLWRGAIPSAAAAEVAEASRKALDYWLTAAPTNPDNWYPQYIASPCSLGRICLLLVGWSPSAIPTALLARCAAAASSAPAVLPAGIDNITGSNAVLIATGRAYGAVLAANATAVRSALGQIWGQLAVTDGYIAGVKEDGSFFQHCSPVGLDGTPLGPHGQLYSGGYGKDFTAKLLEWVGVTGGLDEAGLAIPRVWAELLASFVLDGQAPTIVGLADPHFDVSVIGRELSRPGHSVGWPQALFDALPSSLPRWPEFMALARRLNGSTPAPPAEEFESETGALGVGIGICERPGGPGCGSKVFHLADYVVHAGPGFTVTLKMTSNRTMNTECIAGENKKARHLGHGTRFIHKRGNELAGLYPLLDWEGLAGMTVARDGDVACAEHSAADNASWPPSNSSCWADCYQSETTGTTAFVGAATDGRFTVAAMDHVDPPRAQGPSGRVAYREMVVFVDEMYFSVIRGVRVVQRPNEPMSVPPVITTAIGQRRLQGDVWVSNGTGFPPIRLAKGDITTALRPHSGPGPGGCWVHHDGTGYLVLDTDAEVVHVRKTVGLRGNWSGIGVESGAANGSLFTAYAEYGTDPSVRVGGAAGGRVGRSFAAAVFPAVDLGQFEHRVRELTSTRAKVVLSNTVEALAVWLPAGSPLRGRHDSAGDLLGATFYEPGFVVSVPAVPLTNFTVGAHMPCILLVELVRVPEAIAHLNQRSGPQTTSIAAIRITLADPTQLLNAVELQFTGLWRSCIIEHAPASFLSLFAALDRRMAMLVSVHVLTVCCSIILRSNRARIADRPALSSEKPTGEQWRGSSIAAPCSRPLDNTGV